MLVFFNITFGLHSTGNNAMFEDTHRKLEKQFTGQDNEIVNRHSLNLHPWTHNYTYILTYIVVYFAPVGQLYFEATSAYVIVLV